MCKPFCAHRYHGKLTGLNCVGDSRALDSRNTIDYNASYITLIIRRFTIADERNKVMVPKKLVPQHGVPSFIDHYHRKRVEFAILKKSAFDSLAFVIGHILELELAVGCKCGSAIANLVDIRH